MKTVYLLLVVFLLGTEAVRAQVDLNFKTTAPLYSSGSLSNNYTGIGNPAVDVSVNVVSNGSTTFNAGTPKAVNNGLEILANFPDQTSSKVITITFSIGVSNLSFGIYGVDKNATSQDKVVIIADRYGNAVSPNITPSAYATVSGNTILGIADEPAGSTSSPVQFTDFVKTLTIIFTSGPDASSHPGAVGITIGNLSWAAPLPVTLATFTAKPQGEHVQINWETTWEQNADAFEIQRSQDLGEFTTVGKVAAKGNTDQRQYYGFRDERPLDGANYYRLKQIDRDGKVALSKVQSVVMDELTPSMELLENPTDGQSIWVAMRNLQGFTYHLTTLLGNEVPVLVIPQMNNTVLLQPVQPLNSGIYLLQAYSQYRRLAQKVIVR